MLNVNNDWKWNKVIIFNLYKIIDNLLLVMFVCSVYVFDGIVV